MWIQCPKCHTKNLISAETCTTCGTGLVIQAEGSSVGAASLQDEAGSSFIDPISQNRKRIYLAIIRYALPAGVVFIGTIVLLLALVGHRKPEDPVLPAPQIVVITSSPAGALPAAQPTTPSPVIRSTTTPTEVTHARSTPTVSSTPEFTAVPIQAATADSSQGTSALAAAEAIEWLSIPAGAFTMGSDEDALTQTLAECNATEGQQTGKPCERSWFNEPQRTINVRPFEITKYEITNAQYKPCVAAGACEEAGRVVTDNNIKYDPGYFDDAYPVVAISWHDATTFCRWIGGRLPSESEWEWAARGSDERRYPWGSVYVPGLANVASSYPAPVGSFPEGVSPFGALDMGGNVFEWTSTDIGGKYVVRGGGWTKYTFRARVTDRGTQLVPGFSNYDIGFRCVRSVSTVPEPIATSTAIATTVPTATRPPTVEGLFVKIWQRYQSRLGAPVQGNTSDRSFPPYTFGEMAFEGGHMFFYAGPAKRIWVVYGSQRGGWTGKATWAQYPETWQEGDPEYSCPQEAEYPRQPKWGFGKVWCNYPEVRAELKWGLEGARDIERESPGHSIYRLQQFERGFIFRDSDGWTNHLAYVFFDDGSVVREPYR